MTRSFRADEAAPGKVNFPVTPSDTVPLNGVRYLYIGGTGDLVVKGWDDVSATYKAVPVGTVIPICAKYVMEATTCTFIVALG